jgi:hypothetical protein
LPKGIAHATVAGAAVMKFNEAWRDPDRRIGLIPGKQAISRLNTKLQLMSKPTVSARKLASKISTHTMPAEMRHVLIEIENRLR